MLLGKWIGLDVTNNFTQGNQVNMLRFYRRHFKRRLTRHPWRQPSLWSNALAESLLEETRQIKPNKKHNILLLGPVASGKSSYINSIISVDKGRKYSMARTGVASGTSMTLELIKYDNGPLLDGYNLYDCMGLEPDGRNGMHEEDTQHLLKGYIKSGYKFKEEPITESNTKFYRSKPNLFDKIHCIVFVISAKHLYDGVSPEYMQTISSLQRIIKEEDIPRVLILTKVEELCDEVALDISKMFWSTKIREIVQTASELFSMERASIHPVKNYEDEFSIDPLMNIPLLFPLKQAMHYATDKVEKVLHSGSDAVEVD